MAYWKPSWQRHPYLGGDNYSIADIATYPWVVSHPRQRIDLADYPAVRNWFERIRNRRQRNAPTNWQIKPNAALPLSCIGYTSEGGNRCDLPRVALFKRLATLSFLHFPCILSTNNQTSGESLMPCQQPDAIIRIKNLRLRTFIGIKEEEINNRQDVLINRGDPLPGRQGA
ncbi:GST-like protein yfcG [Serratia fonticola]|uniref:GST-like protein yfcG n=1 Tax=Serratia fonticola TaxID=47917 RepID=A0A4U9VMV3_SERFO|nr:GST-like protein yfcG [Serratia fonticola]